MSGNQLSRMTMNGRFRRCAIIKNQIEYSLQSLITLRATITLYTSQKVLIVFRSQYLPKVM
ncbi:hypothetical protein [Endozoicomonas atrinae]|uniref:hypothetical protein n=1 Tax=Endozoicomonas atrinae TaxID=1333660 RepID=UPI003B002A53